MATFDLHGARAPIDRTAKRGSVLLVLLVALALVAAGAGLMLIGRERAEPYILVLLAVLGMIGVFSLFAAAAGLVRVSGEDANPTLKAVVDQAIDGIVVTDSGGRVIYANAAYRALVNAVDADDIRPVERAFIGDPDVSEAVFRLLKAAREGRRLQEEVRVAGPRGDAARWIRLRIRPLKDTRGGNITVWTVADVTRERERQENIFQELQHAIDYLDHAPAGFFSVDGRGEVGYLNATLASWLDQDLAEISSGSLKLADIVSGDGASLLMTVSGPPGEVRTETLDLDLKTKSGKTVPARLFHKVAFAADGAPGASRTLVFNRTQIRGIEQAQAGEVRFMRFFQNTPMAIATVDKNGNIARHNALFGRQFDSILESEGGRDKSRSILNVVAERDRGGLAVVIARAAGGKGDIAPMDVALAGKRERWARLYVTPVEEGDQEAAIIHALETTEQRNLEAQIAQGEKMKTVGQLAGGMAHDFNNVLSAIIMATDFLLNAHKPTDPSFQDIIQIKQNANRAASLVRQLLAFSRRQTLRPQILDLGEVLSDVTMLLRKLLGEKVTLDVIHGRDLWPVKADLSQFEQVVVNLAVNARDAMPEGGKLSIRTSNVDRAASSQFDYKGMPAGEYVMVEVSDSGTGISPEILDKIFEPFFSTKDVGKGTGLGLSTVYGIIKQSGGFVYPHSLPGQGTTFRIFLPRHEPKPEELAPAKSDVAAITVKKAPADDTGHGTILLVEDEEGLRGLNARGLVSRGYKVIEAGNGVEAIDALEKSGGKVDLVVSDVVMPEMDGPALLKVLRQRRPELKIVFVSGYAEEAFAKSLPENEQFAFLPKPFTLKQLVATVKETMAD